MIGGREVELGDVVDAVLLGAVAAHVVDDAAGGDHEAVAALLDPLHVPEQVVVGDGPRVDLDGHHRPQAPEVGRARDERLRAPGQHRRRHLVPVPAGRGVGHGDRGDVRLNHVTTLHVPIAASHGRRAGGSQVRRAVMSQAEVPSSTPSAVACATSVRCELVHGRRTGRLVEVVGQALTMPIVCARTRRRRRRRSRTRSARRSGRTRCPRSRPRPGSRARGRGRRARTASARRAAARGARGRRPAPRAAPSATRCVRARARRAAPAGRRGAGPRPMLANAATGSPKNIAPKRLIARSNAPASNGWTCASPCTKVTFVEALGRGSARGRSSSIGAERSMPERRAVGGDARRVAGGLAGAAADVEHGVGRRDQRRRRRGAASGASWRGRSGRRARSSARPRRRPTPPPARRSRSPRLLDSPFAGVYSL